ncbi:uncharacterized protein LOC108682179 [Hyalella azteca]|uniref:Uncharacterized protein LOC108682179 n=1 Tax=Hyalella azteca TaxID=294128 RepID=A0A8B7PN60_HYAAZ|nr:uncharacterized protein LOC108682179 [Hyalella azteca]
MRVLWLVALWAISAAVSARNFTPKKPEIKKEINKKLSLNESELNKKLSSDVATVKKAIAGKNDEDTKATQRLDLSVDPKVDISVVKSTKPNVANTLESAAVKQADIATDADFKIPFIENIDTTEVVDVDITDKDSIPLVLTRAALSQLLNISSENLDKELKSITVGNTGITIGDLGALGTLFPTTAGGATNFATITFPDFLGTFFGGNFAAGLAGLPDFGNLAGLPGVLAGILTVAAAVGAGLAALIALAVPALQIANQILAIIAISLLIAYVVEDKEEEVEETGYGFADTGTGYGLSSGYGYDAGPGLVSAGDTTGYSSYSDYRRADKPVDAFSDLMADNTIDGVEPFKASTIGRSFGLTPMINRVAKVVSDAVHTYSNMYGDDEEE